MPKYEIEFKKTVWGIAIVEAESIEKVKEDDFDVMDELDNNCDYVYDYDTIEEVN